MQSAYPLKSLKVVLCFSIIRIITNSILFFLALTHLPIFKRDQGQTSVILLAIKFLKKTIFKEFITNSRCTNLAYLAL